MADLIDRDKMFHGQVIYVGTEDARKGVQDVLDVIWNAPTVDAVEVVRCKDCKWWKEETEYAWDGETELKQQLCTEHDAYFEPDDFCSWGEKKCGSP